MSEMSVKDMVIECLDCHGFDGLYDEAGCGCMLADLAPCNEMSQHCEAAYLFDCSRCAKRPTCDLANEEQPWLMAPNKDHCTPDYATAAPAAACAAQNAALPACAPLTVGEVVHVAGYPDWHAQGGIVEAPEAALKVEPGERFIDLFGILKGDLGTKEVCQNTAKSETASRVLKKDRTAEYMRYLEYGA